MNILFSLSLALFAGLLLSRLAKLAQLPAVTAYLVAGILVGPYVLGALGIKGLGFVSMEDIHTYGIIPDVALGFIAFSIGNEFRVPQLKKSENKPR
jgi:Kef-type K+ transport system membrane component KefB